MTEEKEEKKEEAKEEKTQASEKKTEQKKEEKPEEKKEEKEEKVLAEEEKEIKVPKKFKDIVKEIEEMNTLNLAELVKILEKKFGVSAAAPVAAALVGASAGGEEVEEKSEFNVVLTAIGEKKIEVIKAVRDITQKGLKEAKDLVDAAASEPQIVQEGVKKEEAEEMRKKFEAAGAKVELK